MKTKIYLYCVPGGFRKTDVIGYAISEDGSGLVSHLSSDEWSSKHDMGFTSDWHHDVYDAKYPDGYELEWVEMDEVDTHEGLKKASELNEKLFQEHPELFK